MTTVLDQPDTRATDTPAPTTGAIFVAADLGAADWDGYLATHRHATADHLWAWRSVFERALGHRTVYLGARRDGRVVGVLPLVLVRSWVFGRSVMSLPFLNDGGLLTDGPDVAAALLAAARAEAEAFGAPHVELRHRARQCPELPCRQHKVGMTLALPGSSEDLWKAIDRKIRNQVRKAQKSDLIAASGGAELLDAFYPVFAENMRDLGTPVYPRALFEETLRALPDAARVHVVRLGDRVVAGGVTIRFRDTVVNPWASSLREFRSLCPNMLLYWSMLEAAVAGGAATFDFGRSSPGGGTHHFKLQWGATETPLHWEYLLLRAGDLPDHSPTNPRMQLAIRAWQRLPLAMANRLGPVIARHLP